jgi:hypothetical protein
MRFSFFDAVVVVVDAAYQSMARGGRLETRAQNYRLAETVIPGRALCAKLT